MRAHADRVAREHLRAVETLLRRDALRERFLVEVQPLAKLGHLVSIEPLVLGHCFQLHVRGASLRLDSFHDRVAVLAHRLLLAARASAHRRHRRAVAFVKSIRASACGICDVRAMGVRAPVHRHARCDAMHAIVLRVLDAARDRHAFLRLCAAPTRARAHVRASGERFGGESAIGGSASRRARSGCIALAARSRAAIAPSVCRIAGE